jgi:hypothetical protein
MVLSDSEEELVGWGFNFNEILTPFLFPLPASTMLANSRRALTGLLNVN